MNQVEIILTENIDNPYSLFVFPTNIALSHWADRLLCLKGGTIAMNKFIAWDKFKQNSIKSKVKNKKSIPSALRKIFVSRLIKENSEAVKSGNPPVFYSLIRAEWAGQAEQFTAWLTGILPQLGAWFYKKTNLLIENILNTQAELTSKFEDDDMDMYVLALRYAQFLGENMLFEPAWETPPFNNDGKECFIFFPEALSDFCEYRELLEASEHVKIISTGSAENSESETFFYTNSRSEITEAALYIRALHEKHDTAWDSIAVCIPDSENYEPYVMREFTNRNIPFVKRTSKPLSDYPAGCFFNSVLDCTRQNYSFSSLVSLVLNRSLPWKNSAVIDKLIQFGIRNNCLYSWTETYNGKKQLINIWEDALNNPLMDTGSQIDTIKEVKMFFLNFKKHLNSFRNAESFIELRRQYFIFRELFFDMEQCSDETNLVISRCIAELMDLVELEKDFPNTPAIDPFLFFAEYLNEVNYLAQTKSSGVAILPYKTAASAPFNCHIVLGAGQENLSIVYSRLAFLSRKKREELGIFDEDASAAYINLHKCNSLKRSAFFCCEQTFSGFAIPHSKLYAPSHPKERYAADSEQSGKFSEDHYGAESTFCSSIYINKDSITTKSDSIKLHDNQIYGFSKWKNRRENITEDRTLRMYEETINFINSSDSKSGGQYLPGISPTALQSYYQCSLNWLYQHVFNLRNEQIETSLMDSSISGTVYHAILNYFFSELKKKDKPLSEPIQNDSGLSLPSGYQELLNESINNVFGLFPASEPVDESCNPAAIKHGKGMRMSSLTARLLRASKKNYQYNLKIFVAHFLSFFAGCSVVECEKYYETEKDSYILKGFIDFILRDSSGKYIIVDFKLKHTPSRSDCTGEGENGLSNFQLPVYITLTEEKEQYKVYTALFYSILETYPEVIFGTIYDINTEKVIPAREEDQIVRDTERYNIIFKDFCGKTGQFAKDISGGNFTSFPKNNINCYSCNYHRICRTSYVIERQNINTLRKHK